MSDFDVFLLLACLVIPTVVVAALVTGAVLYRRRVHRAGMQRSRAACRAAGLTHGASFWEGTVEGVHVGACWARYRWSLTNSASYERVTSYRAWINPAMSIDLDAFVRTRGHLVQRYVAHLEPWRRHPRPPRVALTPDSFEGALKIHAADAADARTRLADPDLVAALREAISACKDVRLTDHEVELLGDPYQADPTELRHRLRLAARIARALAHPRTA